LWADDLSGYDSILELPFKIPLYGDQISLFALLIGHFHVPVFQNEHETAVKQPANARHAQGWMLYFMPLMMLTVANNLSAAS